MADVLVKGLRDGAIAPWWRLEGVNKSETQMYPGSAPREEVKAYVLLCVVLMEF